MIIRPNTTITLLLSSAVWLFFLAIVFKSSDERAFVLFRKSETNVWTQRSKQFTDSAALDQRQAVTLGSGAAVMENILARNQRSLGAWADCEMHMQQQLLSLEIARKDAESTPSRATLQRLAKSLNDYAIALQRRSDPKNAKIGCERQDTAAQRRDTAAQRRDTAAQRSHKVEPDRKTQPHNAATKWNMIGNVALPLQALDQLG